MAVATAGATVTSVKDKLLLKEYKLSFPQRMEMIIRGLILAQIAVPIGSAIYFLVTQVHYLMQYADPDGKTASFINVNLKPVWDNLPVYLDHAFNTGWFASMLPEARWDIARHDFRKVLIGFIAFALVGAITVGLKKYKRATWGHVAWVVPTVIVSTIVTATALIALTIWSAPAIGTWGASNNIPYVSQFIGSGQIQLILIGALSVLPARLIGARCLATLQLVSIDRNIAQGDIVTGVRKYIYPAAYRRRWANEIKDGNKGNIGSRWMGITIAVAAPVLVFLTVFGFWLNNWGPAAGAVR